MRIGPKGFLGGQKKTTAWLKQSTLGVSVSTSSLWQCKILLKEFLFAFFLHKSRKTRQENHISVQQHVKLLHWLIYERAKFTGPLILLDLRSIMGCPVGTRSVFTCAFQAKKEFHCIFLGKKAIIISSKHGTMIFFPHYNLFLGKLKENLAQKAHVHVNTDACLSDRAHAPWASHNTP